ncbi:MAG TPA: hypothetical protein VM533_00815 [Fimbriiglobus sp.]|jgi:hypothetical protein|nr:hypothetical protein [Fimbriiglobus sp.]
MPVWKVLLVGMFACVCLALATATIVVPFSYDGGQRWLWMGGLLSATLFTGALFGLFLRHASHSLDANPRGARR